MLIETQLRQIKANQALAILAALEAAGLDVQLKLRADGWHVRATSATGPDYHHVTPGLVDALGQLTCALSLDMGLELGTSELDELGADADAVVVVVEPVVEFCPVVTDETEYGVAWLATQPGSHESRDTEPPPRLFCIADGCDESPAAEWAGGAGYCEAHLADARRAAECEAAMGLASGDAQ